MNNPLEVVDDLYRQYVSSNEPLPSDLSSFDVHDHFDTFLQSSDSVSSIPFFSRDRHGTIANGSLVMYRGMIHDIYDPEFYTAAYKNKKTGENHLAMYRDTIPQHIFENQEFDDEDDGSCILERFV